MQYLTELCLYVFACFLYLGEAVREIKTTKLLALSSETWDSLTKLFTSRFSQVEVPVRRCIIHVAHIVRTLNALQKRSFQGGAKLTLTSPLLTGVTFHFNIRIAANCFSRTIRPRTGWSTAVDLELLVHAYTL
mmetsp:Transcript_10982/g.38108  ORF Transcript_10982/g.38108 Transcript_10982/m.38108 type:complete len:133 (-) Transcript_10982:170-568(-)